MSSREAKSLCCTKTQIDILVVNNEIIARMFTFVIRIFVQFLMHGLVHVLRVHPIAYDGPYDCTPHCVD